MLGIALIGGLALRRGGAALLSCYWRMAIVAVLLLPVVPTLWTFKNRIANAPVKLVVVAPAAASEPVVGEVSRAERVPVAPAGERVSAKELPEPSAVLKNASSPVGSASRVPPVAALEAVPQEAGGAWIFTALLALWLFGALVVFARWMAASFRFRCLCKEALPAGDASLVGQFRKLSGEVGLRRVPRLLTHSRISVPMVGGLLRSRILLPNDCVTWAVEDREMVLLHELAHVRRRDALFHLLSSLAKAMHWVNPLAWVAVRSLRSAAERATDDRVLERGTTGSDYARLLVEFASRQMTRPSPNTPMAASSMAQPSTVESRVRRILDSSQRRTRPHGFAVTVVACGFVGLLAIVGGSVFAQDEEKQQPAEKTESSAGDTHTSAAPGANLGSMLEEIVIPDVFFEEATLVEAVDFCIRKSREHDPKGRDLNMIVIPNSPDFPASPLNLKLSQIPLGELLRYMALLSGMELKVEPHSVVFRPASGEGGNLHTKTFSIPAELINLAMAPSIAERPAGGDPFGGGDPFSDGGDAIVEAEPSAREWLQMAGVGFPDGCSALYEPLASKLIVRNTRHQLALVEEIVKSVLGVEPPAPPRSDGLRKRMRSVIIPTIDFAEASLSEAVDFLRANSGDEPINLIVVEERAGPGQAAVEPAPTINLQLRNVPFETALNYITEIRGYSYRVEPHALVLSPMGDYGADPFSVRTFPIEQVELQKRFESRNSATKTWLNSLGVMFPRGTSAHYDPVGKNLILRNSLEQIGLVADALASIDGDQSAKVRPEPPADLSELTAGDEAAAINVIRRFLKAKTVEDRAFFIRDPQRVKPLMTEWYGRPETKPLQWSDDDLLLSKQVKKIVDHNRYFIIVLVELSGSGAHIFALEQTQDAIRLDWETSVGYQPMPLGEFKTKQPREPVEFRVKVKPTDYYNNQFSDEKKYQAVELSYPGKPEFKLYGYIDRGEEWAEPLLEQLDGGLGPSLIVKLKYPDGEIKDAKQVQMDSIVADSWWLSEQPEGGK